MLPEAKLERVVVRTAPRVRPVERLAELPVAVWLVGFVAVSTGVRFVLAWWLPAPWIFSDELRYSELAKSFAATGHFAIRDTPGLGLGPVYPLLLAPAYAAFESVPHAYVVAKAINALVMSLAAVPAYFLARRLLTKPWSLAAAGLVLALPSMVYTGMLMTENVSFPLFLTAVLGIVRALERPTAGRQVGALAMIALTVLTRAQAIALVPALVTAIVAVSAADAAADERLRLRPLLRRLARYLPTGIALFGGVVVLAGWQVLRGRSLFAAFGDAQGLWHLHYSIGAVARWFFYHVVELDLYVGVLPFAAFLVLARHAFTRSDRALRVFALVSLSVTFWLLLVVATFASTLTRSDVHSVSHVEDRYTFYVVPFLVIALLAWVSQRLPSSARQTGVAAIVAGTLVLTFPYEELIRNNAVADTQALLPWSVIHPDGAVVAMPHVYLRVAVVMLSLAGLFYLLRPPRLMFAAPLILFVYLSTILITAELRIHSVSAGSAHAVGSNPSWIDKAIGPKAEAVVIWSGRADPHVVWENEFFNRSVGRVYYLRQASWAGLPEQKLTVNRRTGKLVDAAGKPLSAPFALADPWVLLRGRVVARDRASGMRLYRLNGRIAQISGQ